MELTIVAVTGMPGSGKGEAVEVARDLGIPVARMGDMIWEEVRARGLELEDGVVGSIATSMRSEHGPDIWARRTADHILSMLSDTWTDGSTSDNTSGGASRLSGHMLFMVDGLRTVPEVGLFKERFGPDFQVLAIHASPDTRFNRLLARARPDEVTDRTSFDGRDRRELDWGLGEAIALADHVVVNEGGQEEIRASVRSILEGLSSR